MTRSKQHVSRGLGAERQTGAGATSAGCDDLTKAQRRALREVVDAFAGVAVALWEDGVELPSQPVGLRPARRAARATEARGKKNRRPPPRSRRGTKPRDEGKGDAT